MNYKILILILLTIILISILLGIIIFNPLFFNTSITLFTIDRLIITDDFLLSPNEDIISSGIGTIDDPFVIENLLLYPKSNDGIQIINTSKFIHLNNITIVGGFNGVIISDSKNIFLTGLNIHNVSNNGITLKGSNFISINDSKILNPGKHGIFTDPSYFPENTFENKITNSLIDNSKDTSILVFGNNTYVSENSIMNSNFRSLLIHSPFFNSTISKNYIENSFMEAIHAVGYLNHGTIPNIGRSPIQSTQLSILHNEIVNMHEDGIELQEGVSHSLILGNIIRDSPYAISINEGHMNGIEMWIASDNNKILNNIIKNTGGIPAKNANGIIIAESSNNLVEGNIISNVPGWGVVILWDGDKAGKNWPISIGNIIQNNTVFDAKEWNTINKNDNQNLTKLNTLIFD